MMNHDGRLAPVSEEPVNDGGGGDQAGKSQPWRHWLSAHFPQLFHKKCDLRLLLSVLACPLFPLSVHPKHALITQVSSSPQYIIQHFTAATGCRNMPAGAVKNMYATGKVSMSMVDDLGGNGSSREEKKQQGCFVTWQMGPHKWLIELVVSGQKVVAGCDGAVAWRHTPWLPPHSARGGGPRPLRRLLQGLDPFAVSSVFSSSSSSAGEKNVSGVDCFALKLSAGPADLARRGDGSAEMIKHGAVGYFSQRSGLLVGLEDSYLTRIQDGPGARPAYWETTTLTEIEDYRAVEMGLVVAHSGRSSVAITRFGDGMRAGGPVVTRMEETYVIDDVAFNVPGLSEESFIPPQEMRRDYPEEEGLDWTR